MRGNVTCKASKNATSKSVSVLFSDRLLFLLLIQICRSLCKLFVSSSSVSGGRWHDQETAGEWVHVASVQLLAASSGLSEDESLQAARQRSRWLPAGRVRGYLWPAEEDRESFPFDFLGLFQERGAASPFLLQEGERQLQWFCPGRGLPSVWAAGLAKEEEEDPRRWCSGGRCFREIKSWIFSLGRLQGGWYDCKRQMTGRWGTQPKEGARWLALVKGRAMLWRGRIVEPGESWSGKGRKKLWFLSKGGAAGLNKGKRGDQMAKGSSGR